MVLINFGLSCGQRSLMSTQTAGLGCHESSLPEPDSSRILHGRAQVAKPLPRCSSLACREECLCVLGGRPGENLCRCAGGNSVALS